MWLDVLPSGPNTLRYTVTVNPQPMVETRTPRSGKPESQYRGGRSGLTPPQIFRRTLACFQQVFAHFHGQNPYTGDLKHRSSYRFL